MSTPARRRLMRDFKKLQEDPPAGVSGAPTEDNILLWHAIIFGPQDTPFEDGTFKLVLEFTEDYPNKPPSVRFSSKMFHPNVYADGSICLDILQNRWSPTYDVAAILTSIQSLLDEPNPNSPANSLAAQLYQENRREYEKRVQQIVEQSWLNFAENDGPEEKKPDSQETDEDDTHTNAGLMEEKKKEPRVILVLSGKGGVGKSTVATQLALTLASRGEKVGILDVDLCGPSVPKILGLSGQQVHQSSQGWVPVFLETNGARLAVMSIGFLLSNPDDAVVWRGPKKNAMIKQFLTDVVWGDIDYLIVDTPPGTSDEHISLVEAVQRMNPLGAVLVTTPQAVSVADVRREWTFCKKANLKVLGVVENMSGYVCPHCAECTNIFSSGGGEWLANYADIPFLGRIPIEPQLTLSMERGENFVRAYPESTTAKVIHSMIDQICQQV